MNRQLIDRIGHAPRAFTLARARVPAGLMAQVAGLRPEADGCALVDIAVADGVVSRLAPAGCSAPDAISLDGACVWPVFADIHTHIDKTHTARRVANPDRTLLGAVAATRADYGNWSEADLRARAGFALRCAHAHGTALLRSHIDALGPQADTSWRVMSDLRREWRGRIDLQFVAMAPIGFYLEAGAEGFAARAAENGALLGGVTILPGIAPDRREETLERALARLFALAAIHGLDIDLHVDESLDPAADSLLAVAEATIRHRWQGRVTCGHCCSLSAMQPERRQAILDRCAEAGVALVSLPLVNSWLQDRRPAATPLRRGVAPLHEAAARGIAVALASDNCRDAFHPFGDYDLLEVLRETTRTAHLDDGSAGWAASVTTVPARLMGRDTTVRVAAPADFIVFSARSQSELLSRPQSDRVVLRAGRPLAATAPSFDELDRLPAMGQ